MAAQQKENKKNGGVAKLPMDLSKLKSSVSSARKSVNDGKAS